jgi:hypothetical protein
VGHDYVILSMPSCSEKPLIAWAIDLVARSASVTVFVNYAEIVTSTKLTALAELIVDRFFALLICGNTSI